MGEALERLVQRHEILRTTFQGSGSNLPLQSVSDPAPPPWREAGGETDLDAVLAAERRAPFPLADGPLLRVCLAPAPEGHWLVLTLPALCADSRSLLRLAEELSAFYCDRAVDFRPPPVQYAKYADWQNLLLEEDTGEGRAHWRGLDPASVTAPALPFAARPDGSGEEVAFDPQTLTRELPRELAERVEEGAAQAGVAADELLLAAWQALLGRLCGQEEVLVGVACDGREYEVLKDAVGLIARFLPILDRRVPAMSLAELAQADRDRLADAREHQELFEIGEVDGAGPAPYFPVLFEHVELPAHGLELAALPWSCTERFDLRLTCFRGPGRLALQLGYDPRTLPRETVARLGGAFEALLRSWLAAPVTPVGDLGILDDEEIRQTLEGLNDTAQNFADSRLVHELFAAQAERVPERTAVICGMRSLTYRELHRRSNRLAHHLLCLGVGPETKVALCLDRSLEMVTALWAVLKAGGAYVPIDSSLPAQRVATLLEGASPVLALSHLERPQGLVAAGFPVLAVEEAVARGPEHDPRIPVAEGNLAYMLFTSGSTGQPKGVEVEHRQLANYVRAVSRVLDLPDGSRYGMVSTFAADLGNTVFFPALCSGGCLYVAPQERTTEPEALAADFGRVGIDCLKIVPSHLVSLLSAGAPERLLPRSLLVLGGEALSWELAERVRSLVPGCRIVNHYGPTETTVGVLTFEVEPESRPAFANAVPIGRPLANVQAYLLDAASLPVPTGVPAEICIGGANVARGYFGAPELTADRFVPDPFGGRPGARLYRTGDRARFLPGGAVEFLGRVDHQVKIRGFRVELGEVEAALESHPEVLAAVAAVTGGQRAAGPSLVAYVVARGRGAETAATERLHRLPNGLEVHHLNRNETVHLYRQIFEDQIYLRHGIELADGCCVVDVGANIGLFSLFVHQACCDPQVHAFEPSPVTFEVLRQNVERLGLGVSLHQAGLGEAAGTATFTFYPRASIMSGFHADAAEEEALFRSALQSERRGDDGAGLLDQDADELVADRFERREFACEIRTLSSFFRERGIERVDLLKVDAEKSELEVFAGIAEEDWPRIHQVTAEVHAIGDRVERIHALLQRHGFAVTVEQDDALADTGIYHVYAVRPRPVAGEKTVTRPAAHPAASARRLAPAIAPPATAEGLRDFLRRWLPEAMVPSTIVFLDTLPLNRNGKVDRSALPDPGEAGRGGERDVTAPRTAAEEILAQIWAEVLGLERVGVDDNFFELGGDSILSIQVTAKANRAGLRLTTRELFRHQTVAELAAVATAADRVSIAEAGPVTGPVPLTPIQRWWLEQDLPDAHHFNQAVLLTVRERLDPGLLAEALRGLLAHHDALRLRFHRDGNEWRQENAPPTGAVDAEGDVPFCRIDLSAVPDGELASRIEAEASSLQAGFDLARGPLLRMAQLDLGLQRPDRLLLAVHHLAMDGVSWRILIDDLERACGQLQAGQKLELPPRTTSFRRWAELLTGHAQAGGFAEELPYWTSLPALPWEVLPLPADGPGGDSTAASARTCAVALGREETASLLQEVLKACHARIDEVLLSIVALTLRRWSGGDSFLVDLEGHGREEIFDGVDLSRTVGWFTTHFPVALDLRGTETPLDVLARAKDRVRRIPGRGLGYGALRYLTAAGSLLAAQPQPELKLNYLGQIDQVVPEASLFAPAAEPVGTSRSPRGRRSHLLEIDAQVRDHRLHLVWTYSASLHRQETVEALAADCLSALRSLIAETLAAGAGRYTPSDFPLVQLDQDELDAALLEIDFQEREPA